MGSLAEWISNQWRWTRVGARKVAYLMTTRFFSPPRQVQCQMSRVLRNKKKLRERHGQDGCRILHVSSGRQTCGSACRTSGVSDCVQKTTKWRTHVQAEIPERWLHVICTNCDSELVHKRSSGSASSVPVLCNTRLYLQLNLGLLSIFVCVSVCVCVAFALRPTKMRRHFFFF